MKSEKEPSKEIVRRKIHTATELGETSSESFFFTTMDSRHA